MRSHLLIYITLILSLLACSTNKEAEETTDVSIEEEFEPISGMQLYQLTDMPGVSWDFDTIYGVCAPDTFVLWMKYRNKDYLTNVYGIDGSFPMLTTKGEKRVAHDLKDTEFVRTDFNDMAILSYNQSMTRKDFQQLRDSAYQRTIRELVDVVTDFYYSLGMPKYMAGNLAANWKVINAQSEAEGTEPPNPFNGANYIEFDPSSLSVQVPYPTEGIVEVAVYCLDPFTLGRPGWAYWTIRMCKENGKFKVREMPARHRKFTTG